MLLAQKLLTPGPRSRPSGSVNSAADGAPGGAGGLSKEIIPIILGRGPRTKKRYLALEARMRPAPARKAAAATRATKNGGGGEEEKVEDEPDGEGEGKHKRREMAGASI
jgi:hypothetical protein